MHLRMGIIVTQLVRTPLWGHQATEADRLESEPRVLIAWEMGTGKTLFGVEKDLRLRRDDNASNTKNWRTLVVAPLNTHDGWYSAFANETDLRIKLIDRKARHLFTESDDYDVYIMHYEALRLMPDLRGYFQHAIFDECHRIKNRKAKQTIAAKKLQVPFLTDMSGSPATDRPQDIWSVLNHLKPKTYSSYWKFFEQNVEYEMTYPQGYRKSKGPTHHWLTEGLDEIQPFYSRVLKDDVMDLPPKTFGKVYVTLDPIQRRAYEEMKEDMIAWVKDQDENDIPLIAPAIIAKLQRLQMFAMAYMKYNSDTGKFLMADPSAKVDAVMEILSDNPDEQFLIFSQFKQPLQLLGHRMATRPKNQGGPIKYGSFTGDDKDAARKENKRRFIDRSDRVFLSTIATGGVGVDGLQTNCSTAIFLDRSWSPLVNDQAEDRLHRGGQTKSVNIIDIMARDTVDQERHVTIEMKRDWVLKTLGDRA